MTFADDITVEESLRDVREKRLLLGEYDRWLIDKVRPYLGRRLWEVGCGWGNVVLRLMNALIPALRRVEALVEPTSGAFLLAVGR